MWGLEIFGSNGETNGGNGVYIGTVGETITIPGNSIVTVQIKSQEKINVIPVSLARGTYFRFVDGKILEINNTSPLSAYITITYGV